MDVTRTPLLVLLGLLAIGATPAHAQDTAAAEAAFNEATTHYEARHHQLALESFERSYELMRGHPRQPLVLFNIGRCQQELGRYETAIATYERYLSEAPPDAPFIGEAREHIRDMRGRVGQDRGNSGETLLILGAVGLGLGAATALAAIPTGVLALDAENSLESACDGGACTAAERGRIDELQTLTTVTDVLWITGAAVAAVGTGLLFAGWIGAESETTAAIGCTEAGCVGTIQGRF